MIPGPDGSRVPTAAPGVLDQPSRLGLFINAAAMIGFGAAHQSPAGASAGGPRGGGGGGGGVPNIPECCWIEGLLQDRDRNQAETPNCCSAPRLDKKNPFNSDSCIKIFICLINFLTAEEDLGFD